MATRYNFSSAVLLFFLSSLPSGTTVPFFSFCRRNAVPDTVRALHVAEYLPSFVLPDPTFQMGPFSFFFFTSFFPDHWAMWDGTNPTRFDFI
jgi:hypothetical protein